MKSTLRLLLKRNLRNYLGIYHPYLLAIYPVVTAYWRNKVELNAVEILRPLLLTLLVTVGIFILISAVIKPIDRAGLFTSITVLLFFNYQFLLSLAASISTLGIAINRSLIILFIASIFVTLVLDRKLSVYVQPHTTTRYLNVFSIVSGLYFFLPILVFTIGDYQNSMKEWRSNLQPITANYGVEALHKQPDIYYIVLDGYAREDVLDEIYNYDNSAFLKLLQEKGFYIADQSRSNYNQTTLSLASSLNLDYLDFLQFGDNVSTTREPIQKLVEQNRLVKFLRGQGYTINSIDSGYKFTRDIGADNAFALDAFHMTSFEALLLENSAIRFPFDLLRKHPLLSGYSLHRARIENSFNTLSSITNEKSPKFVFAHIIAPHPPFVFTTDGKPVTPDWPYTLFDGSHYIGSREEYINSYGQQLNFINKLTLNTIDEIINNSLQEPIIIIQADHGPGAYLNWASPELSCIAERTSILNAYYLPDSKGLYPDITPINTFRVILDTYFDTSLGTLPDKVYFATWDSPYDFIDVTNLSDKSCN